jgi:hypothetical protein
VKYRYNKIKVPTDTPLVKCIRETKTITEMHDAFCWFYKASNLPLGNSQASFYVDLQKITFKHCSLLEDISPNLNTVNMKNKTDFVQ